MYRCDVTKQLSKPSEKPYRLVVERREKTYMDKDGHPVGQGWEVVKEIQVGLAGLRQWVQQNPEDLEAGQLLRGAVKAEAIAKDRRLREGTTD